MLTGFRCNQSDIYADVGDGTLGNAKDSSWKYCEALDGGCKGCFAGSYH